jgi:hypothetical protein
MLWAIGHSATCHNCVLVFLCYSPGLGRRPHPLGPPQQGTSAEGHGHLGGDRAHHKERQMHHGLVLKLLPGHTTQLWPQVRAPPAVKVPRRRLCVLWSYYDYFTRCAAKWAEGMQTPNGQRWLLAFTHVVMCQLWLCIRSVYLWLCMLQRVAVPLLVHSLQCIGSQLWCYVLQCITCGCMFFLCVISLWQLQLT